MTTPKMTILSVMDKTVFRALAGHPADVCVTICLRTHGSGMEVNEQDDQKALKEALREARRAMQELKIEGVIDDILSPAEQLLKDENFWHHQKQGLALFLAADNHSCCLLPYDPGSVVHVHTSFILMPLTPMLLEGESYYLLTLSKQAAQLYQGYKFELVKLDIPGMPQGFEDVVQYFQKVDKTLGETVLGKSRLPLLLVGIESLLPLYRQVNTYPHLLAEELHGNFEHVPVLQLFAEAQKKMEPWFEEERRQAFQKKADHGIAPVTTFLQDVIRAAYEGRIAQLYVARGPLVWGHYTAKPEEPVLHAQEEPGDDCLTNQAVVQTILHGGQAYVMDKEKMPSDGDMAAVLRYS